MNAQTQKMQDKVAKLLRQAEDVVGTPEEAIFQAKAFELVAKYGLDMSRIQAAKAGLDASTVAPDAISWEVAIQGKYLSQQALLLHGIARSLHCTTVFSSGKGWHQVYVFGVPVHLDRVKFLWEILRPQMLRLVETVRPENIQAQQVYDWNTGQYRAKSTSGQVRSFRRAWIAGFASEISSRIRQQEQKAVESAGSGALALYRDDKARATQALEAKFPKTKRIKPRTRYDANGYAQGQRDGASAAMAHSLAG